MHNSLYELEDISQSPLQHLNRIANIHSIFDLKTNDSGNISFLIAIEGKKYFLKTAGHQAVKAFLSYEERIDLINNAYALNSQLSHSILPHLYGKLNSAWGPVLIFEAVEGTLISTPAVLRANPESPFFRFCHLAYQYKRAILNEIMDLHVQIEAAGWLAGDFYDGCIIYDFNQHKGHFIDMDSYHDGPFINQMGRMFGSKRFMAPEEFEKGAWIDFQTTVFNLGRLNAILLEKEPAYQAKGELYQIIQKAIAPRKQDRFDSVFDFYESWKRVFKFK